MKLWIAKRQPRNLKDLGSFCKEESDNTAPDMCANPVISCASPQGFLHQVPGDQILIPISDMQINS